jgi:hypothetical protein
MATTWKTMQWSSFSFVPYHKGNIHGNGLDNKSMGRRHIISSDINGDCSIRRSYSARQMVRKSAALLLLRRARLAGRDESRVQFVPFSLEISGVWGPAAERFFRQMASHRRNLRDIDYFHWSSHSWRDFWLNAISVCIARGRGQIGTEVARTDVFHRQATHSRLRGVKVRRHTSTISTTLIQFPLVRVGPSGPIVSF